jgi:hypothetical protein
LWWGVIGKNNTIYGKLYYFLQWAAIGKMHHWCTILYSQLDQFESWMRGISYRKSDDEYSTKQPILLHYVVHCKMYGKVVWLGNRIMWKLFHSWMRVENVKYVVSGTQGVVSGKGDKVMAMEFYSTLILGPIPMQSSNIVNRSGNIGVVS